MLRLKILDPSKKINGENAKELDQFFTKPEIAQELIRKVDEILGLKNFDRFLEPSAGSGSFYDYLPVNKIGIDIDATIQGPYLQRDFLLLSPPDLNIDNKEKNLVIGNPPFGKNSSKALQFLNHSFLFANFVCFILPSTFNKISMQNRVDLNFSLKYKQELPKNSFTLNGENYNVPCVFQIWEKLKGPRSKKILPLTHEDFTFVDSVTGGKNVFIIQRVGARAGQILKDVVKTSKNYYYIEPLKEGVLEKMKSLDLENSILKFQTAGYPSIGKAELVELYSKL